MNASFHDQLVDVCGGPVYVARINIESYMGKRQEEGRWFVFTQRGDMWLDVARFTLICMPGCCGVVISTDGVVMPDFRNRGIGTVLNHMRRQMAYLLGYSYIMCTDVADNEPQQRILERAGWELLHEFTNRRTGNTVNIHGYDLADTKCALGFDIHRRVR